MIETFTSLHQMKIYKLIALSTAHLHPLEAAKIEEVASVSDQHCSLVSTAPEYTMRTFYKDKGLVCLSEVLKLMKEKYDAEYVLFDPDVDVTDELKEYDW